MEEFLSGMASGANGFYSFSWMPQLSSMSENAVPITVVFAAFGCLLLNAYTRSLGALATPLNFGVLFAGGLLGNLMMSGARIPFQNEFHGPMVFALAGMVLAAVSLMALVRSER